MVSRMYRGARDGTWPPLAPVLDFNVSFHVGVFFVLVLTGCGVAPPPPPTPPASVADGVYTARQARLGRRQFEQICEACHRPREFRGSAFRAAWRERTVGDLFQVLLDTMPPGDPGGLEPEVYADVVAYVLSLNGYPEGEADLPADALALRRVRFEVSSPSSSVAR